MKKEKKWDWIFNIKWGGMRKEKWKRCKLNKAYLISSWGRIFSLKSEHLIKPEFLNSRCDIYLRVHLYENGEATKTMLHHLVSMHFDKEYYEGCQVNHDDLNTLNCNINNLSVMNQSENIKHSWDNRTLKFNGKEYKLRRGNK